MVQRFLGWRMVAVAFFVDFVAVGFFFYSYGVFFKAIEQEFGGSRLGVSLGLTVTATVGAFAAPFIGHALDRFPLKRVIAEPSTRTLKASRGLVVRSASLEAETFTLEELKAALPQRALDLALEIRGPRH